ncbi:MAG: tripartite tricarboxylate transporter substrate binding protein [Betaproteobacteria bacterium]|nr:tripartite tricarboxylate transporter substrate binding protein [Betaproteobacteria bacterium]
MRVLVRVVLLAALAVGQLQSTAAAADAYPSRAVRIIVGYSPGTTSDVFARIIAQKLSERWGQSVIVENRDGAAGSIGADAVAKSEPDGYTLMLGSNAFTLGKILRVKLPYDPFSDFYAVTQVAQTPNIFLVGTGLGVKNLKEFIALAKASPGKLQYASSGRGTPSHLTVELFKAMAGVSIEEIPYKSSGQAVTDTISGQVALNAPGLAQGIPHTKGGKVVALGITGSKRAPGAPDIPTLAEQGVPGYEAYGWHGIFAPAKTPAVVAAFLTRETIAILGTPDMREKFGAQGAELVASESAPFVEFLRRDLDKWQKLFAQLGIKPE